MNNAKFVPNGLSPQRYVDRLGEAKTSWAAKRQDMINGLTSQSGKAVESTVNDAAATVKAADQLRGQLDSLTNVTDFNFVNLHHVDQERILNSLAASNRRKSQDARVLTKTINPSTQNLLSGRDTQLPKGTARVMTQAGGTRPRTKAYMTHIPSSPKDITRGRDHGDESTAELTNDY